jgi:CheY-specific phosphatase CheX
MHDATLRRALAESVEETLEKMFFIAGLQEPDPDALPPLELAARVPFHGAPSGRFTLRVTDEAARSMAADFLGEEASADQVREVVCELANMICGAALSRAKDSGDFRLASPEWLLAAEARPRGAVVHAVEIGGGVLEAAVEMETAACPADEKSEF